MGAQHKHAESIGELLKSMIGGVCQPEKTLQDRWIDADFLAWLVGSQESCKPIHLGETDTPGWQPRIDSEGALSLGAYDTLV